MSPLGEDFASRELIVALKATPIIVSPYRMGAVNQIRLTLEAMPPRLSARAHGCLLQPAQARQRDAHKRRVAGRVRRTAAYSPFAVVGSGSKTQRSFVGGRIRVVCKLPAASKGTWNVDRKDGRRIQAAQDRDDSHTQILRHSVCHNARRCFHPRRNVLQRALGICSGSSMARREHLPADQDQMPGLWRKGLFGMDPFSARFFKFYKWGAIPVRCPKCDRVS